MLSRVALPRERTRGRREYFYGLLQLPIFPAELADLSGFGAGHAGRLALVDLSLATHLRSVSALIPSRPETAVIAAHCVG
jgi:hypothetical protein